MAGKELTLSELGGTKAFELLPGAGARAQVASELGILGVRKLRFSGEIAPDGARDWRLTARLGATIQQTCVVTLEPVTTRIDVSVVRRYLADMPETPDGDDVEIPEDDSAEPLPRVLDLEAVMVEALALELPAWPRADGVEPVDMAVTEPGKAAMTDEQARPFATLESLKKKLSGDGDDRA